MLHTTVYAVYCMQNGTWLDSMLISIAWFLLCLLRWIRTTTLHLTLHYRYRKIIFLRVHTANCNSVETEKPEENIRFVLFKVWYVNNMYVYAYITWRWISCSEYGRQPRPLLVYDDFSLSCVNLIYICNAGDPHFSTLKIWDIHFDFNACSR